MDPLLGCLLGCSLERLNYNLPIQLSAQGATLASLRFMFGRGRYGRRGFWAPAYVKPIIFARHTDQFLSIRNLEPIYGLCGRSRTRMGVLFQAVVSGKVVGCLELTAVRT